MIGKKLLLAGIAVGALAAAGSANALGVSLSVGTSAPVSVTAGSVYTLAKEVNLSGLASTAGQFETVITPSASIGAGTYLLTVTYSGATFATAPVATAAALTSVSSNSNSSANSAEVVYAAGGSGGTATAALTSGGAIGSSTVTYTIQVLGTGTLTSFILQPGLTITGTGATPVSVAATLLTSAGATADSAVSVPIIAQSTKPTFTATLAPTAVATANTIKQDGGLFDGLTSTSATLGTLTFTTNTALGGSVYRDLNGDASAASDITSIGLSLAGDFTKVKILPTLTNATVSTPTFTTGGEAVTISTNGTVSSVSGLTFVPSYTGTGIIAPSAYSVTATGTLLSSYGATSPISLVSGAPLQNLTIVGGFTYVIPWVNSNTQALTSGNTTVIRVSDLSTTVANSSASTPGANVYGVLYNATVGTTTTPTATAYLGTLTAANSGSKELVITSTTLQNNFGNFGRGDLKLIIADALNANNLASGTLVQSPYVVKRVFSGTNGGLTEMSILSGDPGTVATGAISVTP